jgi:hypothetical protein
MLVRDLPGPILIRFVAKQDHLHALSCSILNLTGPVAADADAMLANESRFVMSYTQAELR